ncbi:MAG: HesA/MoeB/ThiF family protein [Rubrivivax sp.]|nr:HesA/MoeB/ThiF family protein [Rubrivivax sp.]
MNDEQLLRYARHLMLDEIGIEGQGRLLAAHALVIGAGGLGSPAALYLGTAGVGRLTVVDHDEVDLTNLQRQIAHNLSRLGLPKAESVRASVAAINPDVRLRALVRRADEALLDELVPQVDVVLDCCDNFRTRHAVNAACVRHGKPLVSGAAIGWDAQVSVYDTRRDGAPCYACLFPADSTHEEVSCATMGVFAPLVGIVGSMQAAEALKLLLGAGQSLAGRLLMLDARSMHWDVIALARQAACPVCSGLRAPSPPAP